MPTRFMTHPHQMRAMAGRFGEHAQTVNDEAAIWASTQSIAGAELNWNRPRHLL